MVCMLLIVIKGPFDYVSRSCLLLILDRMDADGSLIRWTDSFMSDRSVSLIIFGHLYEETAVETGVLQGSQVSSVLFNIQQKRGVSRCRAGAERVYSNIIRGLLHMTGGSRLGGASVCMAG